MSLADSEYSESRLNAMTKAELAALAAELGIEGVDTSMLKADMITAILSGQGAAE